MKKSLLQSKSYAFALCIVKHYKQIVNEHKEFVLSKQMLRSGTSVGAMVHEAEFAQSRADFISKLSIGLKEANETKYWIQLLLDSNYLDPDHAQKLLAEVKELISILVASIRTLKNS